MSLDVFFNPRSVAVIGASRDKGSVGYGVVCNLLGHPILGDKRFARAFKGKVFLINPNAKKILGKKCWGSVLDVPASIDLAVVCVPAKIVPAVMKQCVQKKVKGAIIISAGFTEVGEAGKKLQEEVASIARRGGIRVIGPNCLGLIRPKTNLNASFAPVMPRSGGVALLSQSGALIDSILDWAVDHDFGMSAVVSFGNQSDLDAVDVMEFLAKDPETKCIAVYLENVTDGKKFMSVAKKVAARKPVVAIKAGRTKEGSSAVSSHTGNLAGSYEIYRAAFEQCGITTVDTIEDLLLISDTLSRYTALKGGIAIITNGGGCGVLCADDCRGQGITLPSLMPGTVAAMDASGVMHPAYSRHNPLDIIGDALPQRYQVALDKVLKQDDIGGAIVIQTLQTMTDPIGNAEAVVASAKKFPRKPILCVFLGGHYTKKGVQYLEAHGIKNFDDVSKASLCMAALKSK